MAGGIRQMIASIYKIRREHWKALGLKDLYSIHKAVYSLFPRKENSQRDFLFADKGGNFHERIILIVSKTPPIKPEFGEIETKEIPDSFLQWNKYGFEVTINPVKRDNATGKLLAIRGKQQLLEWFIGKAPSFGFTVEPDCLQINSAGVVQFEKNGVVCTYNSATFIGKLTVSDRSKFIESFEMGIGRAKGFGFGLMQLIPLQEQTL